MKWTFPLEKCKNIIQNINSKNFDIYRTEILDIIAGQDQVKVERNFTYTNTNTDIIIHTANGDIKLRDLIRSHYNIAPYYHDGPDFAYRSYIQGNMWGKHIEYPHKYTNNYWFWLSIGHETAHAKNHQKESKNKKLFTRESAIHINEKMGWTDWYHIIKNMEYKYDIQLLNEFENIENICVYANIHLLSYIAEQTADQIKQTLLEPKHFRL